jgi:YhcH/YjgK/YiaL family protein
MIIDKLANSHLYETLSPRIKRAFEYLHQADLNAIPDGKYEIDGDVIYAAVQGYSTKTTEQGKWEAHQRYIDIQYIIQGAEMIGYNHVSRLIPGEYDPAKDVVFLTGEGTFLPVASGEFMLLYPEDAHMPCIAIDEPGKVKKVVVKIALKLQHPIDRQNC